jgi:hypothetical protein
VYYEEFSRLENKPGLTILEFGVAGGGSLQFYRKILGKNVRIIGVDLNPKCAELANLGFEIFIGDQSDPKFLSELFQKIGWIDILIEDGGHTNFQQITTIIKALPHINDGGVILIDDMQCSYHQRWGNPSKFSTVNFLKSQIEDINYRSNKLTRRGVPGIFSETVFSITFYEALVALRIDRSLASSGEFITSSGDSNDYSSDYRYFGNSKLEQIYKISKIIENNSNWHGKLGIVMNKAIKSKMFRQMSSQLIRYIISRLEKSRGHDTKVYFKK